MACTLVGADGPARDDTGPGRVEPEIQIVIRVGRSLRDEASGDNPMKRKPDGESERHRTDRLSFYLSVFVVAPMIGILAAVPLVGLCAIYVVGGHLGEVLGSSIFLLLLYLLNLQVFMPLIDSLVCGDWFGLVALRPGWLGWVRSVGLF